jgi:hypothetical protein
MPLATSTATGARRGSGLDAVETEPVNLTGNCAGFAGDYVGNAFLLEHRKIVSQGLFAHHANEVVAIQIRSHINPKTAVSEFRQVDRFSGLNHAIESVFCGGS